MGHMRASALAFALITLINIPDLAAAVYMPATLKYDRMIAQGQLRRLWRRCVADANRPCFQDTITHWDVDQKIHRCMPSPD
jgi:hypothetical protein